MLLQRSSDYLDKLVSGEIKTYIKPNRERSKRIRELKQEIDKLERKKNTETQFNKKVEINEKIRALMEEIKGEH